MIPQSYSEWRRCITDDCGIALTKSYIQQRIQALRDKHNEHTVQFIRCYGEEHWRNVMSWFEKAMNEAR
ncbi:MAG: hypothetical protein ACUVRP_01605 [Chlorobiales bacterium]